MEDDTGLSEQLEIKATLTDCIRLYINDEGTTPQEAADRMGIQRSWIGGQSRGHISFFSIPTTNTLHAGPHRAFHSG